MSIRVTCEKCGVVLKVKEELAGTKGKCPACRGTLNVPTLEQAAAAAPLSATETAPTAAVGDTGAIKIPTKPRSTKVAASPGDSTPPPPVGSNGTPADHAAEAKAPPPAESRKSEKPRAEKPPSPA
ncbi:MAG TPA: hypothetical protein VM452_01765, partial [Caulifigura sp.]|nr:hypothetical protein [Caulifigura sp.]